MSTYVDELAYYRDSRVRRIGLRWCHLFADTLDELHTFAQSIGMQRAWFQNHPRHPHYDLTISRRLTAIKLGAISVTTKEWIREHQTKTA